MNQIGFELTKRSITSVDWCDVDDFLYFGRDSERKVSVHVSIDACDGHGLVCNRYHR